MSVKITTAAQQLVGVSPDAWADDPNLTNIQRAALRATGRSEVQRRYLERGRYLNTAGQGMGADGAQKRVTPPTRPATVQAPQDFAPAVAQAESQSTQDQNFEQLDGVSYSNSAPVQMQNQGIDPVTAALLATAGGATNNPGTTIVRETSTSGGGSNLLPLIAAAGMFLI